MEGQDTDMSWTPTTLEDRLIERYHAEHPGALFLELPVGGADETHGPRRLDGLLVPGSLLQRPVGD